MIDKLWKKNVYKVSFSPIPTLCYILKEILGLEFYIEWCEPIIVAQAEGDGCSHSS